MNKDCSSCGQKDRCQEIYAKLGRSKGPNVALKAIFAFVVPIATFVIAAGFAQPWLKSKLDNAKLVIIAQVAVGLAAAAMTIYIGKKIAGKRRTKTPCPDPKVEN